MNRVRAVDLLNRFGPPLDTLRRQRLGTLPPQMGLFGPPGPPSLYPSARLGGATGVQGNAPLVPLDGPPQPVGAGLPGVLLIVALRELHVDVAEQVAGVNRRHLPRVEHERVAGRS